MQKCLVIYHLGGPHRTPGRLSCREVSSIPIIHHSLITRGFTGKCSASELTNSPTSTAGQRSLISPVPAAPLLSDSGGAIRGGTLGTAPASTTGRFISLPFPS